HALAPVEVHDVAQTLEGVEGQADRQQDLEDRQVRAHVELAEKILQAGMEEAVVLEHAQCQQVAPDAGHEPHALGAFVASLSRAHYPLAADVVEQRGSTQYHEQVEIESTVEVVACQYQQDLARHIVAAQQPVEA